MVRKALGKTDSVQLLKVNSSVSGCLVPACRKQSTLQDSLCLWSLWCHCVSGRFPALCILGDYSSIFLLIDAFRFTSPNMSPCLGFEKKQNRNKSSTASIVQSGILPKFVNLLCIHYYRTVPFVVEDIFPFLVTVHLFRKPGLCFHCQIFFIRLCAFRVAVSAIVQQESFCHFQLHHRTKYTVSVEFYL